MAKYHITAKGVPAICRATKRPCPLGGAEEHFNSIEEAQSVIDERMKSQYGVIAENNPNPITEELTTYLQGKDNRGKYASDYRMAHKYEHDSYGDFLDEVGYRVDQISEMRQGKPEQLARDIGEKIFITATPEEMVRTTALYRDGFRDKKKFKEVLAVMENSNGMKNGRWL